MDCLLTQLDGVGAAGARRLWGGPHLGFCYCAVAMMRHGWLRSASNKGPYIVVEVVLLPNFEWSVVLF